MAATIILVLKLSSLRDIRVLWLTLLGLGFIKPAPGTVGSAVAVVLWWFFFSSFQVLTQFVFLLIYILVSIWLCRLLMQAYDLHDPGEIVADEFAGMWLALIFVPQTIWFVISAFLLFRFLDIVKPFFIGWVDRNVRGGVGVMLDDLLAGMVTALILVLVHYLLSIS